MAELTFKSAGVSTREIDLSGPTTVRPQGIPAGVIGTAQKGPAFVPVTVATYADFVADFGGTDGKKFGPLAMNEWMRNARAGTFVRVLGVGDAKKRDGTTGRVNNAGFVVGGQLPQDRTTHDGGALGINPFADDTVGDGTGDQHAGRTYFLGALMREVYDSEGQAAAESRVSFGALSGADFEETTTGSPYGEGLRFLDSGTGAAQDSVTIWFHEGSDDDTNADGETIPKDGRNIPVSVGLRSFTTLTVDTVAGINNRVLELTDVRGNKFTITLHNDGTPPVALAEPGDASLGTLVATQTLDISGLAEAAVAEAIRAAIDACSIEMSVPGAVTGAGFVLTLDQFGVRQDEPDGGTLTAATPNILLAGGDFGGGLPRTAADIVDAAIAQIASVGGLDADLTITDGGDELVITQGTIGTNGNDADAVADSGNSTVSGDWVHDVATITLPAEPFVGGAGDITGGSLVVKDMGTDQAGTANSQTLHFNFVDSVVDLDGDGSLGTPFLIGLAASVVNETSLEIDDPAGAWHAGDTITIIELDAAGIARSTSTFTAVTAGGAGSLCSSINNGGGSYSINFDLDHVDAAGTAAQTIYAALEDFFDDTGLHPVGGAGNYAEAGPDKLTGTSFAIVGDTVTVTQPTASRRDDAVAAIISLGANVEITEADKATITEGERGYTQRSGAELATQLEALLGTLNVSVTPDGLDLIVEQAIPGAHDLVTTDDAGLVAEDTRAGAGDFGVGGASAVEGTLPANLTATVFSGGGDAVESADPQHSNWRDAGIDTSSQSKPIIRAVLMTPGGVHATLLSARGDAINAGSARSAVEGIANATESAAEASSGGSQFGLVDLAAGKERFTLLLNGHVSSDKHPAELTCSFDPQAADYFINVLNSDPACIEMAGHCVYASYDIHGAIASVDVSGHEVVSGDGAVAGELVADAAGVDQAQAGERAAAFLIHGNSNPDFAAADAAELPIYEDFQERFQTAKSPWIISQVYGAKPKNLFKIHALDDGIAGSGKFKITISNIMMGAGEEYGRFDVFVRDISDDDVDPRVFEKFIGVDLNPASDRYIARAIGDQFMYYDFDKRPGSQKLVVEGIHPQRSKYIRVEMAPEVGAGAVPNDALPLGHRGYDHLVTSANGANSSERFLQDNLTHIDNSQISNVGAVIGANEGSIMNDAIEPPVPFRLTIAQGTGDKKRPQPSLCWGTMFQVMDNLTDPNNSVKFNSSILSYGKFYPGFRRDSQQTVSVGNNSGVKPKFDHNGTGDPSLILDADKFNNNMFTLERIQVITKVPTVAQDANPQVLGKIDHRQWAVAEYRRNGELKDLADTLTLEGEAADGASIGRRFLDPKVDLTSPTTRRYMKFSFFLQGGFDGTNIFDAERSALTNRAAVWEMDDANQGGVNGSTVAAFRKAIDVMSEKADVDIKLLAIPGMREEAVTDYAIDAVEDRFDAMYIMDIEEKSVQDQLMVDYSSQKPSVNLTVEELKGRNLDSSFAAAYFPDVVITDPALGTNVQCPPSVAVLGAFSLNDSVAHPWFAPAGFSRGALTSVVETQVKLSRTNLDALYESDINPLAAFPHTPGVVVWGQKTLQRAQSALDRVNVRRLLIEIRREVRNVGNSLLFEPNREETLGRFSAAVNPILQRIQQQQGLDKFKVVIDTTTTTQADIENNTVRGKIFLQPTRTVEFISLDFVVTNAGMEV